MRGTVRALTGEALEDYAKTPRKQWVLRWPQQAVLAASQIAFTQEAEEAMRAAARAGQQALDEAEAAATGRAGGSRQSTRSKASKSSKARMSVLEQATADAVTQKAEESARAHLSKFYRRCSVGIEDLVRLVRGQLPSLQRATLSSLLVLDVHSKDIAGKLYKGKVEDRDAFDWQVQLRHYWYPGDDHEYEVEQDIGDSSNASRLATVQASGGKARADAVRRRRRESVGGFNPAQLAGGMPSISRGGRHVGGRNASRREKYDRYALRMVSAQLPYTWEYLGTSSRLVITPLTDRCYRTLTAALHLNLGGAPEGPAGTGKTESVKDLSKSLGRQCVVFNCSEGLDVGAMGKFFCGLAATGAWACFDEFNRIGVSTLSVVAQQIMAVQQAVGGFDKHVTVEGVQVRLVRTTGVFITMNPGYAGRTELPDNLKALFRPVAMVVPDYALIAEILLFSEGYLHARALSSRIVTAYRMASEQLSQQAAYDYGMRAVIATLRTAGSLKRATLVSDELGQDSLFQGLQEASVHDRSRASPSALPDTSVGRSSRRSQETDDFEADLVLHALRETNEPKLLARDLPLFRDILRDLFPKAAPGALTSTSGAGTDHLKQQDEGEEDRAESSARGKKKGQRGSITEVQD